MPVSQNGWPANDITRTSVADIPGTIRSVRLEKGNAGYLLRHFAAWFDKNIEDIEGGVYDDWGYAERPIRGGTELSNHASGTAIDLNATKHPLGAVGTFSMEQAVKIRSQLTVYGGAIRWGGDYTGRKDEMHFEINRDAAFVARIADRLRNEYIDPVVEINHGSDDMIYIRCGNVDGKGTVGTAILSGPFFIGIVGDEVTSANENIKAGLVPVQRVNAETWKHLDMRSHALYDRIEATVKPSSE